MSVEILTEIPIEIFSELLGLAMSYYVSGGSPVLYMTSLEPMKALSKFGMDDLNETDRNQALLWFKNSSYYLLEVFNSTKFPRKNRTVRIGKKKVKLNMKQYMGYVILFPRKGGEMVVMNWIQKESHKSIRDSKGRNLMKKFHNDVFKWFTKLKFPMDVIDQHQEVVLKNSALSSDSSDSIDSAKSQYDEMINSVLKKK